MADWYTSNYVFVGDKDDVDALYDKLKEIEANADPNKSDDLGTIENVDVRDKIIN